jgi:hypothetical protein
MSDADAPATDGAAPAPKQPRKPPARPDFTSNPKYAPLLSVFGVVSAAELNDHKVFTLTRFKEAAAAHAAAAGVQKPAGAFKSWTACIEQLLSAPATVVDQHIDAEAAPSPQPDQEGAAEGGDDAAAAAEAEAEALKEQRELDARHAPWWTSCWMVATSQTFQRCLKSATRTW